VRRIAHPAGENARTRAHASHRGWPRDLDLVHGTGLQGRQPIHARFACGRARTRVTAGGACAHRAGQGHARGGRDLRPGAIVCRSSARPGASTCCPPASSPRTRHIVAAAAAAAKTHQWRARMPPRQRVRRASCEAPGVCLRETRAGTRAPRPLSRRSRREHDAGTEA